MFFSASSIVALCVNTFLITAIIVFTAVYAVKGWRFRSSSSSLSFCLSRSTLVVPVMAIVFHAVDVLFAVLSTLHDVDPSFADAFLCAERVLHAIVACSASVCILIVIRTLDFGRDSNRRLSARLELALTGLLSLLGIGAGVLAFTIAVVKLLSPKPDISTLDVVFSAILLASQLGNVSASVLAMLTFFESDEVFDTLKHFVFFTMTGLASAGLQLAHRIIKFDDFEPAAVVISIFEAIGSHLWMGGLFFVFYALYTRESVSAAVTDIEQPLPAPVPQLPRRPSAVYHHHHPALRRVIIHPPVTGIPEPCTAIIVTPRPLPTPPMPVHASPFASPSPIDLLRHHSQLAHTKQASTPDHLGVKALAKRLPTHLRSVSEEFKIEMGDDPFAAPRTGATVVPPRLPASDLAASTTAHQAMRALKPEPVSAVAAIAQDIDVRSTSSSDTCTTAKRIRSSPIADDPESNSDKAQSESDTDTDSGDSSSTIRAHQAPSRSPSWEVREAERQARRRRFELYQALQRPMRASITSQQIPRSNQEKGIRPLSLVMARLEEGTGVAAPSPSVVRRTSRKGFTSRVSYIKTSDDDHGFVA